MQGTSGDTCRPSSHQLCLRSADRCSCLTPLSQTCSTVSLKPMGSRACGSPIEPWRRSPTALKFKKDGRIFEKAGTTLFRRSYPQLRNVLVEDHWNRREKV